VTPGNYLIRLAIARQGSDGDSRAVAKKSERAVATAPGLSIGVR
jgi:hypothetical protein